MSENDGRIPYLEVRNGRQQASKRKQGKQRDRETVPDTASRNSLAQFDAPQTLDTVQYSSHKSWLARFCNSVHERARFVLAQRSPRSSHLARDAFLEKEKTSVCRCTSAKATLRLTRLARGRQRKDGKRISLSSFSRAYWYTAVCNFRVAGKKNSGFASEAAC
jgi:hypothetical protein